MDRNFEGRFGTFADDTAELQKGKGSCTFGNQSQLEPVLIGYPRIHFAWHENPTSKHCGVPKRPRRCKAEVEQFQVCKQSSWYIATHQRGFASI